MKVKIECSECGFEMLVEEEELELGCCEFCGFEGEGC